MRFMGLDHNNSPTAEEIMGKYTIELECPTGEPRPGDLLPGVLEGTGITINPEDTFVRLFGRWGWNVPDEQVDLYESVRSTVKDRIAKLYDAQVIRAGSW